MCTFNFNLSSWCKDIFVWTKVVDQLTDWHYHPCSCVVAMAKNIQTCFISTAVTVFREAVIWQWVSWGFEWACVILYIMTDTLLIVKVFNGPWKNTRFSAQGAVTGNLPASGCIFLLFQYDLVQRIWSHCFVIDSRRFQRYSYSTFVTFAPVSLTDTSGHLRTGPNGPNSNPSCLSHHHRCSYLLSLSMTTTSIQNQRLVAYIYTVFLL